MIKKVLLIEPGTELDIYPPSGLLSIAAVLREKGYDVAIKDYSGCRLNDKQIASDLQDYDFIGIKVLTSPIIKRAIVVSKIAKEQRKIVVWGGPHPTVLPELTLKEGFIDAIVIGEGELAILDLIDYFNGAKKEPLGSGIKKNGIIKIFGPQKKFVDLNKLPMPAWDLLGDIDRYFPFKKNNVLTIAASRGCMFKCGFCHNANETVNKYLGCFRLRDVEKIIKEFEYVQNLTKKNIGRLEVGGDLHLSSGTYAKKFNDYFIKNRLKLKWNTSSRFHFMNNELIDQCVKAGCESILFGVESGSPRLQKMMMKPLDLAHAVKVSKRLRDKGVLVSNAYIFGHPTETKEELKMTLDVMKKIHADQNLIQLYRPLPGTPYYKICLENNRVPKRETLLEWANSGVIGDDVNVSDMDTKFLFREFYKANLKYQGLYLYNQLKFLWRSNYKEEFFNTLLDNKFTFKAKQFLFSKIKKY